MSCLPDELVDNNGLYHFHVGSDMYEVDVDCVAGAPSYHDGTVSVYHISKNGVWTSMSGPRLAVFMRENNVPEPPDGIDDAPN